MLHDLGDTVLACSLDLEVTRFLPTPVIAGRKQGEPRCEVFHIQASVQPTKTKDLQLLPEGQRSEGAIDIFSTERLFTARLSETRTADNVLYNGVRYEVQVVEDWFDLGGYFRSMATRLDR